MTRIRKLVWLLLLTPCALAQVQHTSRAETDRFLLCARATFHKAVYMTVLGPWFDTSMKCSPDREEIVRELQERKIPAFENASAILLLPPDMRPDIGITDRYGHKVAWRKFKINVQVGNFGDTLPQGSRPLRRDEQDQIAKVILEQALPPPLVPSVADVDDDTAEMTVNLVLDAHQLSPNRESVVAVFGAGGAVRLVRGELVHGIYRMLWDTPLLGTGVSVGYEDVDGDGTQEIVTQWTELGGSTSYEALAVFNSKGKELTRQEECYRPLREEPAQFACPIWGADVELERASSGKYDILDVPNDQADPQDMERYKLVNGRYSLPVPVLTAIRPTLVSRKMVNGKLTLIGRNFIRDAEVRFVPATSAPQGNGPPQEIRVRAEFVSSTELRAPVSEVLHRGSAGEWLVRIQNTSGHSGSVVFHVEAAH